MSWREYKKHFRLGGERRVPHAEFHWVTPYFFIRFLWYWTDQTFKAWPTFYQTGVVIGWRWPWWDSFKEKQWSRKDTAPLAIYPAMDLAYLARAAHEIKIPLIEIGSAGKYIGPVIRTLCTGCYPRCDHNYWIADCQDCARKALLYAIRLRMKYEPIVEESTQDRIQRQARERLTGHVQATKDFHKMIADKIREREREIE
jgi:hypothetical protein